MGCASHAGATSGVQLSDKERAQPARTTAILGIRPEAIVTALAFCFDIDFTAFRDTRRTGTPPHR
jgi:hypothetical protein